VSIRSGGNLGGSGIGSGGEIGPRQQAGVAAPIAGLVLRVRDRADALAQGFSVTGGVSDVAGPLAGTTGMGFDGSSGWIVLPNDLLTLPSVSGAFSVAFWASAAYSNSRAGISWSGTDDLIIYPFDTNNGNGCRVFWRNRISAVANEDNASRTGWHLFCFVQESGASRIMYVDDQAVSTHTSTSGSNIAVFNAVRIGTYAESPITQAFNGSMADVRIYNRALTPPEIVRIMGGSV
jgi:hypothetical protein